MWLLISCNQTATSITFIDKKRGIHANYNLNFENRFTKHHTVHLFMYSRFPFMLIPRFSTPALSSCRIMSSQSSACQFSLHQPYEHNIYSNTICSSATLNSHNIQLIAQFTISHQLVYSKQRHTQFSSDLVHAN